MTHKLPKILIVDDEPQIQRFLRPRTFAYRPEGSIKAPRS